MARKSQQTSLKFSDRERFNWGFWDGLAARDTQRPAAWFCQSPVQHFDAVYVDGYRAGAYWTGTPQTSDAAWAQR